MYKENQEKIFIKESIFEITDYAAKNAVKFTAFFLYFRDEQFRENPRQAGAAITVI